MKVYVYHKCSTCKDALAFLKKNKIEAEVKEITETPPSIQELHTMLERVNGNLKKLFNTSGQLYRELKLNEKLADMPLESSLKLLSENGMLVKRPFLIGKNFGFLGFKEDEWKEIKTSS